MKKTLLRKMLAAMLGAALLLAPMPVSANVVTDAQYEEISASAQLIEEVMARIMERYVGGDVSVEALRDAALKGMSGILDSYSEYMTAEEYKAFFGNLSTSTKAVGITMASSADSPYIRVTRVLDNSPAKDVGVQAGDLLITANGTSLKNKTTAEVKAAIGADKNATVTLIVRRGTKDITFKLTPRSIYVSTVQPYALKDLGIANPSAKAGYLQITSVGDNCAKDFEKEMNVMLKAGVKRLILDLRGNTGGYLDEAVAICRLLVPAGPIIYTYDADDGMVQIASTLAKYPFERIVVLTNNGTASAAEVIASALQDSDAAVVVGTKSYGKGVIQSLYSLTTGGGLKITTQEYFRRTREKLNGIGITPDTVVKYVDYIFEESSIPAVERDTYLKNAKAALALFGVADVKAFQKNEGLPQTGVIDGLTANAINRALDTYYAAHDVILIEGYKTLMK